MIIESLSVILWNIRPIDSRYSLVASLGELIFNIEGRCKVDACTVAPAFLCKSPPQHGACGGVVAALSGTTINWKPFKHAEMIKYNYFMACVYVWGLNTSSNLISR